MSAIIAPTHHCATRCLYCYAERRKTSELTSGEWERIFDEMAEIGITVVTPDNGDTLVRPDGMRIVEMLVEHDFNFVLSTKVHLSRADVARLMSAGFDRPVRHRIRRRVQLSVDAVDDEVSKRLLGVARSRVRGNAETFGNFMEHGIMPRVKTVVTGLNADQLLPIVETYHALGARKFTFTRYTRTFFRHQDMLFVRAPHEEVIDRQLETIGERYPDIEIAGDFKPAGAPRRPVSDREPLSSEEEWELRSRCGGGWSCIGIAADGSAFLCEQMPLAEEYIVGDARTQSIREIWDGERMRDFIFPPRERFTGTVCHDCEQFEDCLWSHGRCYRDAFFAYGTVHDAPPMCPRHDRPGLVME